MLFFLFILFMAIVGAVIYRVRNRHKPAPAYVSKPKSFTQNQFKEEFGMEKETKVIKEKVNTETSAAKIERVAAAKVHEEIAEELTPLKRQLSSIQSALNELETSGQQNTNSSSGQNQQQQQQPNQLLQQMQDFSSQAQQQQQKTFQQLQQTIHQTAQMLGNVEQSLQSINTLNQITQQINQSQQKMQQQQQQQKMQGQSQQGQSQQGQSGQQNYSSSSFLQ